MRLDTMLAGVDDSPDTIVDGSTHANANLKLDISSAAELRVAESISQELDYWEKLVFSFDMDRDPGGPSRPDAGSNARRTRKRSEGQSQTQRHGVPPPSSGQPSSGSSAGQAHGQRPMDSQQLPQLHFATSPPSASGQAQNPQLPPLSQFPGLDPYTLAQLAALSAIQNGQHAAGPQQPNIADPFALLRQVQGLLYPYGNMPPGSGGPIPGFPQAQPGPSRLASSGPSHSGAQHSMQPSALAESSSYQWPPQLPGIGSIQFPMPPIDPALLGQLSHLSLPNIYQQSTQTPGAGPSSERSRTRSRSNTTSNSPSTPVSPTNSSQVDEVAMTEDKRRRNTLASARFRIKKKHKTLALERSVVELETRAEDLEREASELRRENGWLKEMLIMKGRGARAQAAAATAELEEEDEEDEENEEGDEHRREEEESSEDSSDKKGKGKGKAKAT